MDRVSFEFKGQNPMRQEVQDTVLKKAKHSKLKPYLALQVDPEAADLHRQERREGLLDRECGKEEK